MDRNEHISYWLTSAAHDLDTAESLYQNGKYDWCLYLGHLVIEKAIKAKYVSIRDELSPRTHNLLLLAEKAEIELNEEQREKLDLITGFNIEARYPDYKMSFYKTCTEEYTGRYFNEIKELFQWIKSLIE